MVISDFGYKNKTKNPLVYHFFLEQIETCMLIESIAHVVSSKLNTCVLTWVTSLNIGNKVSRPAAHSFNTEEQSAIKNYVVELKRNSKCDCCY